MSFNQEINRQVGWSIFASVLMMMAGVLAILAPRVSGIAATIFIGSLLVLAGIAHFVFALYFRAGAGMWWGGRRPNVVGRRLDLLMGFEGLIEPMCYPQLA